MGLGLEGRSELLFPAIQGCSLQGQLFSPFPAVYFQASGAPATPEKLVNVLVAPCLVCNKSMVLRSSGAGSHAVVSLA